MAVAEDLLRREDLDLAEVATPSWTFLTSLVPGTAGSNTLTTTFVLQSGSVQAIRGVFRYGASPGVCGNGGYNDPDDLVFQVQ